MMILPTLQQHLAVQAHVGTLASSISELVKLRIDPATEHLIANEEGSLLAALAGLQLLCSELRTERVSASRPLNRKSEQVMA